jgi:hypothetical protein
MTMDDGVDKRRCDVLLQEYDRTSKDISAMMGKNEQIVTIGLALLTFGFTFGLKEHIRVVFLIIPIGVLIFLYYTVFVYSMIMWLGGYRRWLEQRINQALFSSQDPEDLLLWETIVSKQLIHRSIVIKWFVASIATLSATIVTVSLWYTAKEYDLLICLVWLTLVIVGSIPLLRSALRMIDGDKLVLNSLPRSASVDG